MLQKGEVAFGDLPGYFLAGYQLCYFLFGIVHTVSRLVGKLIAYGTEVAFYCFAIDTCPPFVRV